MSAFILIFVATVLLAIGGFFSFNATSSTYHYGSESEPYLLITEDNPRWNCHTMGNRDCGPVHTHTSEGGHF